ncbi:hypothetical protein [Flavicella sp.]|uniref:TolB family protein n=1 Tax=Flavicella sp. TaxID=2957742 RepID=UPI00301B4B9D
MRLFKLFILPFLSVVSFHSKAQTLGKHASNIKWKSIETENVKIIFSEGTNLKAQRIADVIEYIHNNKTVSVGNKSKKIDIILQNQQTISNGFVTLSPYRSEFFAIGPQDQSSLGTPDWLDLLSMHEYRHALQYANANRGLTKFFYTIAGQDGWAGSLGLSIPSWYLEGDAVLIETLLSENGRGRNPYFFKEQRALFLNNEIYSYHKAQNGSYKDLVPNIYPLGFMINNHIRNNYGIETGRKILADAGRYKSIIYPFSSAMKKYTGQTTTKMYEKSALEQQSIWAKENKTLKRTESTLITTEKTKTVTHYTFPQYLNDGSIIAIKRSYQETPYIVSLKNGEEKKLTSIGIAAEEFISAVNDQITWTEHQKDLRHANKNYSTIVIYNTKTKSKKHITTKTRYFSPSFSYNGQKIIAVNYHENISYTIDVLNVKTGTIIESLPNPNNDFLSNPKWTKNNGAIIYLVKRNSKLAFFKYNFIDKSTKQISDWTCNTIGQFSVSDTNIYFTASFNGIDNIYSIDLNGNKNLKQISSVSVGAYFPSISKNEEKIIYSEFTSKGYKLHEQLVDKNTPFYSIPKLENLNYFNIKTTAIEHAILDSIPANNYIISDYKGFLRGTKLHSWGITTSTTSTSTLGVNVQIQNILNDFNATVSVLHNLNENTNNLYADINYGKGLLNWNLKMATLNRNSYATIDQTLGVSTFSEVYYGAGFSIPLSQYKGNYSRSFNFETNYIQHVTSNYEFFKKLPSYNLNFGAIESSITLSNIRRTAYQNVAPRFGQYLKLNYSKSIDGSTAVKIVINSIFYFPGIFKNHSINIVANWQKELLTNTYQYSDNFSYARGYSTYINDQVAKLSLNYELPVLYPDFGIWGLTYFKRIRLNVFYDASILNTYFYISGTEENKTLKITPTDMNQNSFGGELIFDNIFFNVAPISIGLRESILLNTDFNNPNKNYTFDLFLRIGF